MPRWGDDDAADATAVARPSEAPAYLLQSRVPDGVVFFKGTVDAGRERDGGLGQLAGERGLLVVGRPAHGAARRRRAGVEECSGLNSCEQQ